MVEEPDWFADRDALAAFKAIAIVFASIVGSSSVPELSADVSFRFDAVEPLFLLLRLDLVFPVVVQRCMREWTETVGGGSGVTPILNNATGVSTRGSRPASWVARTVRPLVSSTGITRKEDWMSQSSDTWENKGAVDRNRR